MQRQKGLTLIGFIFLAVTVALLGIVVFRAIPIYNEYFTLQKILRAINTEASEATPLDIRNQFALKAAADYMYDIKGRDLEITRDKGVIVISVTYTRTVPLFANVSLLFDFEASNQK
jgi:hypothetical protein